MTDESRTYETIEVSFDGNAMNGRYETINVSFTGNIIHERYKTPTGWQDNYYVNRDGKEPKIEELDECALMFSIEQALQYAVNRHVNRMIEELQKNQGGIRCHTRT